MFDNYIRKILPIPIVMIESNKDGYKYPITTYSSVIDEYRTEDYIKKRLIKNKKIKSINGWYYTNSTDYKQAIIEFNNPSQKQVRS